MTEVPPHTEEEEVPAEQAPPARKKLSVFSRIVLGLNWFAILGLALACLSPFVSPNAFWPIAFFGLMHPAFVLLNVVFLLWWTIRRRRQAFYTLAMLLISIPQCCSQFRFHFGEAAATPATAIKVMSYNVRLFDLYNWSGNKKARSEMFALLAKQKPDILNLQEFFNQDSGSFRNLDSLKQLLGLNYAHTEYTNPMHINSHYGVVTFSRFPIVEQGKIVINNGNNNICIYTDILFNKDTIRIYNMHLQSIRLGYADYKFLDNVSNGEKEEMEMQKSKNIIRRMKSAYAKRAGQAESIAQHMAASPYPLIVCGDFNDPPVSFTYHTLAEGLQDAFIESGKGFGKTFVNPFPIPRIDYILHSPTLQAWEFTCIPQNGLSDHYPIVCKISKR